MKKLLIIFALVSAIPKTCFSQCTIVNDTGFCAIVPGLLAQSFTANCNGALQSVQFYSANTGTISGGTLNIYSGGVPTGTPTYTQSFSNILITGPNDSVLFTITGAFQIVNGNQYTVEFNSGSFPMLGGGSYIGGDAFLNGASTGLDFLFDMAIAQPVGIENVDLKGFELYPNPTSGLVIVSLQTGNAGSLTLRNSLGQLLQSHKTTSTNQVTLDLSSYPSGIYFIQLEMEDQVITKKLVKA